MKTTGATTDISLEDRKEQARKELRALIIEGLESGECIPADEAFWEESYRLARGKR